MPTTVRAPGTHAATTDRCATGSPSAHVVTPGEVSSTRAARCTVTAECSTCVPALSSGRERIYDGYPDVSLDMITSRTFDGRLQLLEYVPTVLAGPPLATGIGS